MLASLFGLPTLKILPSQRPPSFSMILKRQSMPSATSVKQRFCAPPSIMSIGEPSTRFEISCVIARELPMRADSSVSSRGPIQLNGRNSVNFSPLCAP